jgi:hypothetical protein
MAYNTPQKASAYNAAWRKANPERRRETDRKHKALHPERVAFIKHRSVAKQRGISFLFTFDEWITIWRDSGRWAERGYRKGQYCMARFGDKGPYATGNVRICLVTENHVEYNSQRILSAETVERMSDAAKARWANMSEAARQRLYAQLREMSDARAPVSLETRTRMSEAAKLREARKRK